jgi:hypothetical protein
MPRASHRAGGIEIVGDPAFAAREAERTFRFWFHCNQARNRDAGARDGAFLSRGDSLQKAGEMGLGFVDVHIHEENTRLKSAD